MSEQATKPVVRVAAAIIVQDNKFLIAKRSGERHLAGYWEFPGGKIEDGESPTAACVREIKEELNCDVIVDSYFLTAEHDYDHFRLNMDLFICHFADPNTELSLEAHDDLRFITVDEMDSIEFAPADIAFLPNIKKFMQSFNQA